MEKATRQSFGEALARLGESHPEIVVLDADLAKSTKSELFAKKFPDRFFEMGIAEMNMIGTAAGLAFTGKIPFACSFGCFLTGRYDTIRMSAVYSQANMRLIGTHSGVGIGDDGHSQMGLEDLGLMRALPTMGVFQPGGHTETDALVEAMVREWKGPAYLRLTRQNLPDLWPAGEKFRLGKIQKVTSRGSGRKIVLFATGGTLPEAHKALGLVQGKEISLYNVHSIKPFDASGVASAISGAAHVVTVEDHYVIGGLGSCVAEVMAENGTAGARLTRLGVQDTFGESGEPLELYDKHGISAQKIASRLSELA